MSSDLDWAEPYKSALADHNARIRAPLEQRIATLEADNARLRAALEDAARDLQKVWLDLKAGGCPSMGRYAADAMEKAHAALAAPKKEEA